MNDAAADVPGTNAGRVAGVPIPTTRILIALVRRELWEHRGLWMVPLIISALLLASAAISQFTTAGFEFTPFGPFKWKASPLPVLTDPRTLAVAHAALRQWMVSMPLYLAATVVLYFYLLSSLFDERKDRSILFWKSLPVSDAATVASKLLVALVIVPLGVFGVASVTHLLFSAIWEARWLTGLVKGPSLVWDTVAWLKVEGLMLFGVIMSSLWYAPVAAYLVLISAWARRNVFLWAVLPPLILAVVESVAFGTSYFRTVFLWRLGGIWTALGLNHIVGGDVFSGAAFDSAFGRVVYLPAVFDAIDLKSVLANIGLWGGLAVGGVFAYAAVRIRRFRDDT